MPAPTRNGPFGPLSLHSGPASLSAARFAHQDSRDPAPCKPSLADHVFSAARLRDYRVLEAAGLGDAVALHILDTAIAAQLWLALSLAEVGFRNAADRTLSDQDSEDWFLEQGQEGEALRAADVRGHACFCNEQGDRVDDPVAEAAVRASAHLGRDLISRDDLIAHLMLGFWVVRVPDGLRGTGVDVFALVAQKLPAPFENPAELRDVMVNHVAPARNRVAHHEPLILRAKHVFTRTGDPKPSIDLAAGMLGAIDKFIRRSARIGGVARAFAPMAAEHLDGAEQRIADALQPLKATLEGDLERLRHESRVRRAQKRA